MKNKSTVGHAYLERDGDTFKELKAHRVLGWMAVDDCDGEGLS